ncbi:MAG: Flagellar basal-body rod protein FlgC [Fimbriimonadaceae bacterium]|nr:Flagellar basal-body rod protein FlgC [Fimbriimonadaceae bacterium]
MSLNSAMRVSATGLTAERFRMDVISVNIANANSSRVNGKEPYRRRDVELIGDANGVKISRIVEDKGPFVMKFEPGNPNADAEGMVLYSNVEPVSEMVNMIGASRAYEANIAAFNAVKGMIRSALTIGKV